MGYRRAIRNALALALVSICLGLGQARGQTITINNDLGFGAVLPGIPKTIDKTLAGSAAEYLINGTAGAEITIDFALPTLLVASASSMQIIFTKTDAAVDNRTTPDQSLPQKDNLDAWHTITDTLGLNGSIVWLGGQVVPRLRQEQGAYSASIVLTVAYTGN